jgi:uncharacterized membrane protein
VRAFAASCDNVGAFFGEDIFVAVGAVLLITSFVDTTYHFTLQPLQVALWAVPVAVCALLIHGARSLLVDRLLAREAGTVPDADPPRELPAEAPRTAAVEDGTVQR